MKQNHIKKILKNLDNIYKAIEVITDLIPLSEDAALAPKEKAKKKSSRPAKK